jgi:probable F420-dependent oxidoreductase
VGQVKIGFGAPVSGSWATPQNMVRIAQRAEVLGYHSLWTFQRLLSPVDGAWGEYYRSVHDPLIPLAFLAGQTRVIRLGVAVLNMPFFSPVLLAKQLASLDDVSGGRLAVGLGNGWSDEEFAAVGVSKRDLGKRADEFLTVVKKAWTAPEVAHDGRFYRVPPMSVEPKPAQRPHPPIYLGAKSRPALRRAGRLCDGWVSSSQSDPAGVSEAIDVVRESAAQAGRDPAAMRFVVRGAVKVRKDAGPGRRALTGTIEQIKEDIAGYAARGADELFIDLNFDPEIGSPSADPEESMDRALAALEEFAPSTNTDA